MFKVDEIEAINFDENGKENGTWNGFSVVKKGDEANYCFDCRDKLNADKLNELHEENEWLFKCVENQSALIHELDNTIMAYNIEHNITIKLTEKDLKTLDKALSYYTHQKVEE